MLECLSANKNFNLIVKSFRELLNFRYLSSFYSFSTKFYFAIQTLLNDVALFIGVTNKNSGNKLFKTFPLLQSIKDSFAENPRMFRQHKMARERIIL